MLQSSGWVLLLAQLPASPSSPRVTLWRRARAAGAAGLQNGAWVLPRTDAHVQLFDQLAEAVRKQDGSAFVLTAAPAAEDAVGTDEQIVARFRADRAREYDEFAERCSELLGEIDKETQRTKFTFAELEEIEQDLDKLVGWLDKITARDFFPDEHVTAATERLQRCRQALEGFARAVYDAEGLSAPTGDSGQVGRSGDAGDSGRARS
ncbi:Chromate resistance protein ChrB [Saccharopolyspora halophila]|uniref:Chromate resistance protein ChrB n=1 Tax=Saccharopolyspora halophila TaxID=405551 RepID=UPI0031D51FCC